MTEVSEAAKLKAAALYRENVGSFLTLLATHIQQVSDAIKSHKKVYPDSHSGFTGKALSDFILTEPVDPLAEVLLSVGWAKPDYEAQAAKNFRQTLANNGLKIVEDK